MRIRMGVSFVLAQRATSRARVRSILLKCAVALAATASPVVSASLACAASTLALAASATGPTDRFAACSTRSGTASIASGMV